MASDEDKNYSPSPIPKRKYKLYRSDLTIPIPLRTLNRWRASDYFFGDGNNSNNNDYLEDNSAVNINDPNDLNNLSNSVSDEDSISSKSITDEEKNDQCNETDGESISDRDNEEINAYDNDNFIIYQDNYDDELSDDNLNELDEKNTENAAQNNMLFENSTITTDECVLDLLNFYVKHNITKAALKNALKMQLKLLPDHNEMPKTVFKLFQYAKNIGPACNVNKHYYCKNCLFNVDIQILDEKKIIKCSLCKTSEPIDIGFFHEFDISEQIKFLFERNDLAEKLKLPQLKNNENISDITDGTEYIRVNTRDNRGTHDLTLILNTDGLSLVKSAKSHCWPVMFVIAELPEHIRAKYIIITGLWYDNQCKPSMNLFLKPIFSKLKQCFVSGINWMNPKTGETINSKIVAPLMIADAPARAQIQNILNFNGRYGCNICEIRTVTAKKIPGKKTCRIYPFQTDCRLRSGERMEAQAKKLRQSNTKTQIRGVKGYSAISCLPLVDVGTCVIPEYMHSVLLGVIKQVIGLWFGTTKSLWSMKNKSEEIDDFILRIRPPQSFSRLPRKLSHYNLYKASEFYNFLLFYSLPLLTAYLPEKYIQHWLLLVKGIFNLVKSTITPADLEESDTLLRLIVSQIENLYGDRQLSYNVHQLLHLTLCVKRWGPLQGTSAFSFENYNGFVAKCVHGSKHFGQGIVNNVQIAQGVQLLNNRINEPSVDNTPKANDYKLLGKIITNIKLNNIECGLLLSNNLELENVSIYARVEINGDIYTSEIYKTTKTNSHTVKIEVNHESILYGSIEFFAQIQENLYIMIRSFTVEHTKIFFHTKTKKKIEHVIPMKKTDDLMSFKFNNIKSIGQLIEVDNYVCKRPNTLKTVW